jgi:hypothetical protein
VTEEDCVKRVAVLAGDARDPVPREARRVAIGPAAPLADGDPAPIRAPEDLPAQAPAARR